MGIHHTQNNEADKPDDRGDFQEFLRVGFAKKWRKSEKPTEAPGQWGNPAKAEPAPERFL